MQAMQAKLGKASASAKCGRQHGKGSHLLNLLCGHSLSKIALAPCNISTFALQCHKTHCGFCSHAPGLEHGHSLEELLLTLRRVMFIAVQQALFSAGGPWRTGSSAASSRQIHLCIAEGGPPAWQQLAMFCHAWHNMLLVFACLHYLSILPSCLVTMSTLMLHLLYVAVEFCMLLLLTNALCCA